jgi:hypothetical protein
MTYLPYQKIPIQQKNKCVQLDSSIIKQLASALPSLIKNFEDVNYKFV